MDFTNFDIDALAKQLRHPEGKDGEEVGQVMAQYNMAAINFTFECMDVQPADRVLEIGFGSGEGIAEAARLTPDGFVAGVDPSKTMLEMAEKRNHRAIMEEHVELKLGSAAHLPFAEESFDKVFSTNVFHFWPHPEIELAECLRVLKPGGLAVFYVTHPSSWFKGFETTDVFIARELEEVEVLLIRAGFANVESRIIETNDGKGYVTMGRK